MEIDYVKSLLPSWVKSFSLDGDIEIDHSMEFELQWEEKFSLIWKELTPSEQESIPMIKGRYTEEKVTKFVCTLFVLDILL